VLYPIASLAYFNVVIVRSEESENGIQVFDSNGNSVGISQAAGAKVSGKKLSKIKRHQQALFFILYNDRCHVSWLGCEGDCSLQGCSVRHYSCCS
jgi:hypothetical protein